MRGGIVTGLCLLGATWLLATGVAAAASPPANDDFADARTIVAPLSEAYVEGVGATFEPGEPDPRGTPGDGSVWFDWTAERTGGVEFESCWGMGQHNRVTVYTGAAVDALTPAPRILGRGECEYGFRALAGVTYRVQVIGQPDPTPGAVSPDGAELDLRRFPANDEFEDAYDLGAWTSVGWASDWGNLGATKQPGEPDHAGDPGGSSVWFTWTAPATGEIQITACNAEFTPLIAAYTGTAVDALTPVASAVGAPGATCGIGPFASGQLNFQTLAGTRYDIAVDGRGGGEGTFILDLGMDRRTEELLAGEPHPTAPPPPPPFPQTATPAAKPRAQILSRHIDQGRRSVVFDLRSAGAGMRLRCRLDRRRFAPCGSRVAYRHLAAGRHVFRALAVAPTGTTGAPVKAAFAIRRSG
jgi:hypothetical protein